MAQLKRHLASADHVDVSQYQFINLEAVEAAAESLWPQIRERVFLASRSIIEKRTDDGDLIIQCESGFLVVFADLSGEAARSVTEAIRRDMESFFLGEEMLDLLGVSATSQKLTVEEFRRTLDAVEITEDAPCPEPEAATASESRAADAAAPIRVDDMAFRPAWDVRREAVAAFFATPMSRDRCDGAWRTGSRILIADHRPDHRLALDLETLRRATGALEAQLRQGVRCAIVIPAGYEMLAAPRLRVKFIAALNALPEAVRALTYVRVDGAPVDAPAGALSETCRSLVPHCGMLVVHMPLDTLSLERFADTGASFFGADLPRAATPAAEQNAEHFAALARRLDRPFYLDQAANWETLRLGLRVEARLIAGPVIGEFSAPSAPYRLTRAGLLANAA
ncbi:hypothetical protein DDZ18_07115 [Marinicauda salina]|uniref:Uncharacterized protein n=2 Tax=Marinicauda salina TaxID=2135793 RepID=A0A2U2BTU7_9PROT|nr:hypothetical protein DDZ18_07115 [Marinicauda salina]